MKTRVLVTLAAGMLLVFGSCAPSAATLRVSVEGVRDGQGRIAVAVFNTEAGFPSSDDQAVKRLFVPMNPDGSTPSFILDELPAGRYALALFHDDNLSGKLETNLFGLPKKGYGFSNNVNPTLRSARFDEAAFHLPEQGHAITIKMIYR